MNENALRLHSRYQPQSEADRYIGSLGLDSGIDCFILAEPGLGYLVSSLQKYRPDSKIVILHADSDFRNTDPPGIPAWYPDSGISAQEFLEAEIPDTSSIRLIEWRPSLHVYGESCVCLLRECAEFIKRANASRRTSSAFGKRWVRNFFRNLGLLRNTLLYRQMDVPVIITGSGPSLEAALPQISAVRDSVFILAASSSLPALAAGGIWPDLVISTDGGGWALLHLHALFRTPTLLASAMARQTMYACPTKLARQTMFAISLSAAVPSQCLTLPLLPLNDGSLWQSMALSSVRIPSVLIPQRGTVTASALELAMVLSSGNIFLAGMDLSVSDIKSHARPYGFDHLFSGAASRFRPVYSQYFIRSNDIKAGGSHDVYAAWFRSRIASWPKRIFSMGGNHPAFENGLPQRPSVETGAKNAEAFFKVITHDESAADIRVRAVQTVTAALLNPQYSAALTGELAPLLFASRPDVTAEEIAQTLRNIALPCRGGSGG